MKIEQIIEPFQIDVGAPSPTVLSSEHSVFLIFYAAKIEPEWDGTKIHLRTPEDEGVVAIQFSRYAQFKFGSPNDEAIDGHPYFKYGLRAYAIQELTDSDWIKSLEKMNSGHPSHQASMFEKYRHFIFFFHDTCFEIVCEEYKMLAGSASNLTDEIKRISKLL